MKKLLTITFFAASLSMTPVFANDSLDLEPAINGGVSALGAYASQAEEDAAYALAYEPCIDSDENSVLPYTVQIEENAERARNLRQTVEKESSSVARSE